MTTEQFLLRLWYLMFWPLLDPPESLMAPEPIDDRKDSPPPPPATN
jgi:hypothetical protein